MRSLSLNLFFLVVRWNGLIYTTNKFHVTRSQRGYEKRGQYYPFLLRECTGVIFFVNHWHMYMYDVDPGSNLQPPTPEAEALQAIYRIGHRMA